MASPTIAASFIQCLLDGANPNLLRPTCEAARQHLDSKQCPPSRDVQGPLVHPAKGQILTPAGDAPDRNDAEMLAARVQNLNAGLGQRIQSAVVVNGQPVSIGDRFGAGGKGPVT